MYKNVFGEDCFSRYGFVEDSINSGIYTEKQIEEIKELMTYEKEHYSDELMVKIHEIIIENSPNKIDKINLLIIES